MASPLRIREDILQWVEAEAATFGISVPTLVNTLIERASVQGRLAEARPEVKPPGLSRGADEELVIGARVLLTYLDPATPWPLILAGSIQAVDRHSIDLEVFGSSSVVRLPRIWLVTWHVAEPKDDFGLMISRVSDLYYGVGMRMNPLIRVQVKSDGVKPEVLPLGSRVVVRYRKGDGTLWIIAGQVVFSRESSRHIQPDGQTEVPVDVAAVIDSAETYTDPKRASISIALWEIEGYRVHPSVERAWKSLMAEARSKFSGRS